MINSLIRENIKTLIPYSTARSEHQQMDGGIYLDANENSWNSTFPENRYPDPLQIKLKKKISSFIDISTPNIFLGNGSDEIIDLLIRAFCRPGRDEIIIPTPTYGMYQVCANINDVAVKKISLTSEFELDTDKILSVSNDLSKILFLCSPNNPSGNTFSYKAISKLISNFSGLVVMDEAYIDFCIDQSILAYLSQYSNLVILRTFSKAWGLAGIRLGMAMAHPEIVSILNRIKPPYNINSLTQQYALKALESSKLKKDFVNSIIKEREEMILHLQDFPFITRIYPSSANFILVKMQNAKKIYNYLLQKKILVRDRSGTHLCNDCLRITIGTSTENNKLLNALKDFKETL